MLHPDTVKEGPVNSCCTCENLEFLEGGDGVEWERWKCKICHLEYVVPIEIVRDFNDIELIERRKK